MNIVRNSLDTPESMFNEDNVQNDHLRSFPTSFLSLKCNSECPALLQTRVQDFTFRQAKNGSIYLPNTIHKFHVKAGTKIHFAGGHSSALVCEIILLSESLNSFQILQQNRPGIYWQGPPLLPTFWLSPSGSISRNTLWRFTAVKCICDKNSITPYKKFGKH